MADPRQELEDLRRLDELQSRVKTAPPPATFLSTAGRAIMNTPQDLLDTWHDASIGAVDAAVHPLRTWHSLSVDLPDAAAKVLAGGMQHVREMSPAAYQGSAPAADTSMYDQVAQGLQDKFGSKQAIYKTVGDHPVGTALTAASVIDPALRFTGIGKLAAPVVDAVSAAAKAKLAAAVPAPVMDAVTKVTGAGRRAAAASDTMRTEAQAAASTGQSAAEAQAAADADKAARAATLADRAKANRAALLARQADAAKAATPPVLDVGAPAQLGDIGESVRQPALAAQSGIETKMQAADDFHRKALDALVADREAAGVGVADGPVAQAVIKKSQALVSPDPVARPSVGSVLADDAGGKLHKEVINTLQPEIQPLTVDEAKDAVQQGIEVKTNPDGSAYRLIKPSFEAVDNLRRKVGKIASGDVEGYAGVPRNQAQGIYKDLSNVLDEYAGGARAAVQQNWKLGKKALEPFERVRAGQAVVGTQPGTDIASVPAASIPGRLLAGGRDAVSQVSAVAGEAPVKAAVRSIAQNTLTGVNGADAIAGKIAPGGRLGELMSTDPDLASAVQEYMGKTKAAEAAGAQATVLGQRAGTNAGRADKLNKIAETLQGSSAKAASAAGGYQRELADLQIADPKQVGAKYSDMLTRAHADGTITTEQYIRGQQLAQSAAKDFALKASRDKWLLAAGGLTGLGAGGVSGLVHGAAGLVNK